MPVEIPSIDFAAAVVAGALSFLSPCVLPLIPAYLSVITGVTVGDLGGDRRPERAVLVPSLLFVAGFGSVFTALGASASVAGAFLAEYRDILRIASGLLVIAFGILLLGIIKVPWLYGEARPDMSRARSFGRGGAFVMGAAFAFGWTPCVGPVLGSILALAAGTGSLGHGAALLAAYSAGLGVPFVVTALLFGSIGPLLARLSRHAAAVNRAAGLVLVAIGVLVVTGWLSALTIALTRLTRLGAS
ncbi:MAG TPA: cytochrome c biogenesis protein CcdA [Coriobacteriia bacterium]|nr:cytochrome c biogenesis protein CcdA [Coriobacteriia bacterium]